MKIHHAPSHNSSPLICGTANISSLRAANVSAKTLTNGNTYPTTVVGYSHNAPTNLLETSSLLKSPDLPEATSSSDPNLLTIPDGANIIAIRYKGPGLNGDSEFNIGMDAYNGSASTLPLVISGTGTIAATGAGGIVFTTVQVNEGSNFVILDTATPIDQGTLAVEIDYLL